MNEEHPDWITEAINHSLSNKKPVRVSFLEIVLGGEEMEKINEWSKQTFSLDTTDEENPEASRKGWTPLLQDEHSTVWDTGGGVYVEKILPDGTKTLTRKLTEAEVKEIEKKWPEVGFPAD